VNAGVEKMPNYKYYFNFALVCWIATVLQAWFSHVHEILKTTHKSLHKFSRVQYLQVKGKSNGHFLTALHYHGARASP
jgi:hypothetical protein